MRIFLPLLLLTLPAAAGSADWLAPQSAALLGGAPYAEIAAQQLPMPPTAEQVNLLPAAQRAQQACAMKEVLLLRNAWLRSNGNRSSAALETDSAGAARAAEAPALMTELLQMLADGNLTRPQSYAWRLVWEELMGAYGIDDLFFRVMVQELDLTADEVKELLPVLPLADMGNTVPLRVPDEEHLLADLRLMAELYTALAAQYQLAEDAESAARAAEAARPLVQELLTAAPTRFWLTQQESQPTPAELEALKETNAAYQAFLDQRSRLAESAYFGSLPLRVFDYLAD